MATRYLKLRKDILFQSTHLETLIEVWIHGIGIQHKEALITHTEFIIQLMSTLQKDVSKLQDLLNP
jgi:hypothetical protein